MVADAIPPITSAERDAKSPASEQLMEKLDLALEILQDLITSNALGILGGAADADPPNTAPSYIQDTNPTAGKIDRTDKFKDLYLKITSGAASGQIYRITGTDATNKRINVAENLYAAGVRSTHTYKVIGHRHTGVDSEQVDFNHLLNNPQGATFEWEAGRTDVSFDGSRNGEIVFSSAFTEAPIVVACIETTDNSAVSFHQLMAGSDPLARVKIVTSSGGPATKTFHWLACTPGVWLVNGNLVIAGTLNPSGGTVWQNLSWFRPFARTPAVICSPSHPFVGGSKLGQNGEISINYVPGFGSDVVAAATFDRGGKHGGSFLTNRTEAVDTINFIAIIPTAALQVNVDSPTWGGAGSFKSGHTFEAGVFRRNTAGTGGTITFSAAFGANPTQLLGCSPTTALALRHMRVNRAADGGTTTLPYDTLLGVTHDAFVYFLAMTRGKDSVAASRLG